MNLAPITSRIPPAYRLGLFVVLATSWVTGVTFYVLSRWFVVEGEFGIERHPWQQPLLLVHGAAAFAMMICFGSLLISHVPSAWRLRQLRGQRFLGLIMLSLIAAQIVTAWLLYYLGDEQLRGLTANLHASIGCSLPLVLTAHVVAAYRQRRRAQQSVRAACRGGP